MSPLERFLKFRRGEGVLGPPFAPYFINVALEMWA